MRTKIQNTFNYFTRMDLNESPLFLLLVSMYYILVAFNSSGYYHWDEHYQIIEFANFKLGITKLEDLAWEFKSMIRPSLQPGLCYLIFKVCRFFNISDPFILSFILRLLSALLSIFVIQHFINSSVSKIKKSMRIYYVLLSYLLWFLPVINVRFSSENWSGLFFLLSISAVQSGRHKQSYIALIGIGIFLGISILFRYQSALLGAGLILWLLFVNKLQFKKILMVILIVAIVMFFGFLLDRWFYGEFAFTFYNYFYTNIVRGVASTFGTSPWYEIILYILKAPGPFGVFIFIALLLMMLNKPMDLILWCIVPFLFVHMSIPHKELRFLFPLINLVPFILISGFQQYLSESSFVRKKLVLSGLLLFTLVNAAGLIAVSFKGAGSVKIAIPAYINSHYKNQGVNLIYFEGFNPYKEWEQPKNNFYKHQNMEYTQIQNMWREDLTKKLRSGFANLLVVPNTEITGPKTFEYLKSLNFYPAYQNIPSAVMKIQWFYDESMNDLNLVLFEYKVSKSRAVSQSIYSEESYDRTAIE